MSERDNMALRKFNMIISFLPDRSRRRCPGRGAGTDRAKVALPVPALPLMNGSILSNRQEYGAL